MIIPQEDDFENDSVTISLDEYLHLLDESKFLDALHVVGVENWEGYEKAQEVYDS